MALGHSERPILVCSGSAQFERRERVRSGGKARAARNGRLAEQGDTEERDLSDLRKEE